MNPTPAPCRERVEQFMRRKLDRWDGLPSGCVERDVEQWLPLRPGEGIAHFGSAVTEYRFRVAAETADFPEPVRLYFLDSELSLVRTGIWSFDRDECTQLLNHLAEPPIRVDLVIGTRVVPDSEWVYPAKGLALGVIPETGLIASVSAYRPCEISQYLQTIQNVEQAREFRY